MTRMIGWAPLDRPIALAHFKSTNHLSYEILSHYLITFAFIVHQSHIYARYIDSMRLHRTTVALNLSSFVRVLFSYAKMLATVYELFQIYFQSHWYFIASARAPTVKEALRNGFQGAKIPKRWSFIFRKDKYFGKRYTRALGHCPQFHFSLLSIKVKSYPLPEIELNWIVAKISCLVIPIIINIYFCRYMKRS